MVNVLIVGNFEDDIGINDIVGMEDTNDSFPVAVDKAYSTVPDLVLDAYSDCNKPRMTKGVRGFRYDFMEYVVYFSINEETLATQYLDVGYPEDMEEFAFKYL